MTPSEAVIKNNIRKSLVVVRPISKGATLREEDIEIKRPGDGIAPKYYDEVIGRVVKNDISSDTLLQWIDIE